jgi:hypothetical protein
MPAQAIVDDDDTPAQDMLVHQAEPCRQTAFTVLVPCSEHDLPLTCAARSCHADPQVFAQSLPQPAVKAGSACHCDKEQGAHHPLQGRCL